MIGPTTCTYNAQLSTKLASPDRRHQIRHVRGKLTSFRRTAQRNLCRLATISELDFAQVWSLSGRLLTAVRPGRFKGFWPCTKVCEGFPAKLGIKSESKWLSELLLCAWAQAVRVLQSLGLPRHTATLGPLHAQAKDNGSVLVSLPNLDQRLVLVVSGVLDECSIFPVIP